MCNGDTVEYKAESRSSRSALLDTKHSHFIFVDDGTEESFGKEIELRGYFEDLVRHPPGSEDEKFVESVMTEFNIGWTGSSQAIPSQACRA